MAGDARPLCAYCEEVECDLVLNFDEVEPGTEEMPLCDDCLKAMFAAAFEEPPEGEPSTLH